MIDIESLLDMANVAAADKDRVCPTIQKYKRSDFYTRCYHCGRFLPHHLWIRKLDMPNQSRPSCWECLADCEHDTGN